jgi:DNA-binding MarR family transcriptional regulator
MTKLENELLRHIGTLSRCIHSIVDMKYKKSNLQRGQFIFLTRVCENPGIQLVALTQLCKVDKGTTTKAVNKLIQAGYVTKLRDTMDRRAWNLFPTHQAHIVYENMIAEENRAIGICLSGLDDVEQKTALRLVAHMSRNIEKDWQYAKYSQIHKEDYHEITTSDT